MTIQSFSQINNTLKNYDVDNWRKSVEVGNKFDFKNKEFAALDELESSPKTFGQMLQDSIGKVNQLQHEADSAVQLLASGKSSNLHETLLAVEKADIAFKTMNQVRSKVIDAYKEIMKMQM